MRKNGVNMEMEEKESMTKERLEANGRDGCKRGTNNQENNRYL